jgi:peroxiredoxin
MGALTQAINEYDAAKAQRVPAEILEAMAKATTDLAASGIQHRAVGVGDGFPDFELPNQHGACRRFSDYLQDRPVVLNIYRGGWCPYCNMEMKALHDLLPEIEGQGARLVGMAPETPEMARVTAERHSVSIDILSDVGNLVAEKLGLVFELPQALRPIYEKIGIDIPAYNGDRSFKLPMPATYVVRTDGTVAYAFVDPDYTKRQEPADIVTLLESLSSSEH